jgi:hypothetical protein
MRREPAGVAGRRPTVALIAVVAAGMLAALAIASFVAAAPAHAATRTVEKGISFTGYANDSYDGSGPRTALRQLRDTGATWAMILVTVYQDDADSTTISRTGAATPTDASLTSIIAYAHKIGLKVTLKPQLDFTSDPAHSRSQIGADFSAADWTAWFASYDKTIVHYAKLASAAKCQQFSVGCELDSTVAHATAWRRAIADVRAVYHGKLTYAADPIFVGPQVVGWWSSVDLIGMDMYPTLSTSPHPTVAQLVAGWRPYYAQLSRLHERFHKPIIFTEIGVRSLVGAVRAPWDWTATGAVDLTGQKRWYQAALQTFAAHSWMAGLFFWQWSTYPIIGGPRDTGYTPHDKPAGVVLHTWFAHRLR